MPSFGRLGKHNRSQHALSEQLSTAATSGTAQPRQPQGGSSDDLAVLADAQQLRQVQHQQPQHQQLQQLPQHHHPHQLPQPQPQSAPSLRLYTQARAANLSLSLQTSSPGGSPSFDGQQPQTPIGFDPAVSRSQSKRQGSRTRLASQQQQQQQHPVYGIAPASLDDFPDQGAYQLQQQNLGQQQSSPASAAPQKRSTRQLIKDIFGSSRESHDAQQQPQPQPQPQPSSQSASHSPIGPYDSTAGLALRPSKRGSRIFVNQDSARQVSYEHLDTSPPDQLYQPPDHPPPHHQQQAPPPLQQHQPQPQSLQRRGTTRIQERQAQFESHQQQPQPQQTHSKHQSPPKQAANYDQGALQQPQHHPQFPAHSPQSPHPPSGESHIVTTQLEKSRHFQNAETISQLSHDSSVTDSESRSSFSLQLPYQARQTQNILHGSAQSRDATVNFSTRQGAGLQDQDFAEMAPPGAGGGSQSGRRGTDADRGVRGQVEPPPGPPPGYHHQGIDQGRQSPQPSLDRDPELEKQFKDLLTKYKNVKRLYFDGKSQIEHLSGQVEQLQNAVAKQRMSQSRTAWDDSEYSTRFNRLNGAIINLAFNIRKDWRSLPTWVERFVSTDALKTGKQEMTAVGRAVVSRWLVDEVFLKCFHPALDEALSAQLKEIEKSIRGNSYTLHSQEEFDALTAKVVDWRMATLDGLQKKLESTAATENRTTLTNKITANLTAYLHQFLSTPPPPGVAGSTSVIAELAVAIAANLPLESRDVAIMYPLPGDAVQTSIMQVEQPGLPPLDKHQEFSSDTDSGEDMEERDQNGLPRASKKVRFAGFVALEVRGRQVLAKAPVWTLRG
ncbi:hypothetical protein E4U60_001146 [Claviceps pazoutovae]|uniref:S-adenosylmethionine-dependent methyltransferase-like protein n=1 Tax=Claviceps pazoutovae TaxID=1649127 RepID=A0A9P7MD92_9HYPO|nr:hypothetical protein E4U60_001146 [Claviceps pazoutovae]